MRRYTYRFRGSPLLLRALVHQQANCGVSLCAGIGLFLVTHQLFECLHELPHLRSAAGATSGEPQIVNARHHMRTTYEPSFRACAGAGCLLHTLSLAGHDCGLASHDGLRRGGSGLATTANSGSRRRCAAARASRSGVGGGHDSGRRRSDSSSWRWCDGVRGTDGHSRSSSVEVRLRAWHGCQ